ncbi:NAD-dependent epimerase/dehydratase family protein [Agrococcus sp. HG114]|uniref:NAD-dependent epimerase/dehydratase family protein n=1 Tax=Agrococcus sp. HG114 TaxID=2969757 RepID=UPI00215B41D9|nr:NAD-dependent epimerase/dehydratase family protein [Agrococcus sp. HG114]MCR8670030.1 NAD-dependent epimerase/dehydratase family protein [Agrococcus sp. HG114]
MRIVVVGATGNVGTALLRRLHAAPEVDSIVGVARHWPERGGEPYDGVEWHRADVSAPGDRPKLVQAMLGADAVVHLAWIIRPNRDEAMLRAVNVEGSRRVFEASAAAGVPHLVHASSIGAYGRPDGRSPGRAPVDESFPRHGAPASHYGRQKSEVERILDEHERAHLEQVVARLRPGLIFQAEAGPEIRDYFLGALALRPALRALRPLRLPALPWPAGIVAQAVHADDVADAYWRVVRERAAGAFNVAAPPVVGPHQIGRLVGARLWVPVPVPVVRALVAASYRLRLQPTDPGWVDMARVTPVMATDRIRALGWSPRRSSTEAIAEMASRLGERGGLGNAEHRSRSPLE